MSNDPFLQSRPWRKFRAAYVARHPICAVPGCGRPTQAVDHVIRRPIGPDFPTDDGLNGLCFQHHNRKSRVHDQTGKTGVYQHSMQGCDANGIPLAKNHHWNGKPLK